MFALNFQNVLILTCIIVTLKRIIVYMYYNMYYTAYDFPLYYEYSDIISINNIRQNHNENITHMLNAINSVY